MEITLKVSREKFTNEDGEVIGYIAYKAMLDGEEVRFIPRPIDKRLIEHFVNRSLDDAGETA